MEILKKFNLEHVSIPKLIGLVVLGIIVIFVAISLIGFAGRIIFNNGGGYGASSPSYYAEDAMYYEEAGYAQSESAKLSVRNIAPLPPTTPQTTGDTAEDFEVTEYSGSIKSRNLDNTCGDIEALKTLEYVIFESANAYDNGCDYRFKVLNENTTEILTIIKGLKPDTFNENTYTIKNSVDDYTSEVEILEKKLASVEETLTDAQAAYDQVEVLATRSQDVESLAKIIDSKIQLIERLTNERINIKERIDRLNRSKDEQLDRINYTYFNLSVFESKLVDLKSLKESWTWEIKSFVRELNDVLQALTIGLLAFLSRLFQVAVYLVLALFIIKYGWRSAKYMWTK